MTRVKALPFLLLLAITPLLSGCQWVVMSPSGYIAEQQKNLILIATGLMLLIIVPVMILTVLFAWKYRQSNKQADYDPDFHHSTKLEFAIWGAPIAIILVLGTVTWIATHRLDPYRPLTDIGPNTPVPAGVEPLRVQVVSLDWKWLFIYPEYDIATINELVAPVDRPIAFTITSSNLMNSFFVPALAGQIYAMAGMQTQLHAVVNEPGVFKGFSSNYTGHGFSYMHFKFHGVSDSEFDAWVAKARAADDVLTRSVYLDVERPSEGDPVRYFSRVDPGLFELIVNMCVPEGSRCMRDLMHDNSNRISGLGRMGNPEALAAARLEKALAADALCTPEVPQGLTLAGLSTPTSAFSAIKIFSE
ncbi:ubiquinol oxidase subunit II [Pseudochelatococcus contaminans]|uniref:Ubiquinol oxidase subunit 2 n=1 Tax=Pseudochelatococcus contaminans TaxID=1538103 RepID=A0A7W5Z4E3_9HYPH|nr:ubiquinol oxidase subunit II [Pseudochelatococcus contaminans]MBB3809640.1 cytochrome o ubiquinol oxidase subunit 2 [Pseudochelatococcus contaminans]